MAKHIPRQPLKETHTSVATRVGWLRELLEIVDTLKAQEINLISHEEDIDTTSAAGDWRSMCSVQSRTSRDG
ncbi:MAG: hypothetical protein OXC26_24370 [Albidovulum sp.]|nr:hypothetical protein [Albidovulum sp.]